MLKSLRAVLPRDVPIIPVGGIDEARFEAWLAAGAAGFGIGSALYKPGVTADALRTRAQALDRRVQEKLAAIGRAQKKLRHPLERQMNGGGLRWQYSRWMAAK